MKTLERSTGQLPLDATLFAGDFPVRTYPLPDAAQDWMESGAAYGLSSAALLQSINHNGLSLKTCPAFYPATEEPTLPSSFAGWSSAGMASAGGCWTLNISDSPNDASACSLSQVLETDAPPKYYLSAKAAQGILNRAERRGKTLPEVLQQALQTVASTQET